MFASIVIPTYNREAFLEQAVLSALSQSCRDFEVLVIDDGSTDGTAGLLCKYAGGRLKHHPLEHRGAPAARNAGIEKARGEFILWLDSDDALLPDALQGYREFVQRHPGADVFYGNLERCDAGLRRRGKLRYFDWHGKGAELRAELLFANHVPNPGALVRRSAYESFGGYNEDFSRAHDFEFWSRLAGRAGFKHLDRTVCRWRWHHSNMSTGSVKRDHSYEVRVMKRILAESDLEELFAFALPAGKNRHKHLAGLHLRLAERFLELDAPAEAREQADKSLALFASPAARRLLREVPSTSECRAEM